MEVFPGCLACQQEVVKGFSLQPSRVADGKFVWVGWVPGRAKEGGDYPG
jgi:hypothetical protein